MIGNKRSKGVVSLLILLLVLAFALGFSIVYLAKFAKPKGTDKGGSTGDVVVFPKSVDKPKTNTETSGILAYFKGNQEVWIYKLASGESFEVLPEINTEKYCGEGCMSRFIDISNDGKGIIADLVDKDGKSYIGYVGLDETSNVDYLVEGRKPYWSPFDAEFIYEKENAGLAIFNLKEKKSKDVPEGIRYPSSWLSKDEIIFLDEKNKKSVYTGNVRTGVIRSVSIDGPEAITNVTISPNKKYLLLGVLRGDGYDIGVSKIDGTDYKSITGFKGEAWPGSGYYAGVWSPDNSKVAIKDWFIDKVTKENAKRALKIVDLNGNFIKEYDAKTTAERNLCWLKIDEGEFLVTAATSDQKNYLSIYDLAKGSVKEIENLYFPDSSGFVCK